jgi:FkbM family methyltransferase
MKLLKKTIKNFLHYLGFEVYRYDPSAAEFGRFSNALRMFEIDLVLDVGANEGQFGEGLRASGYKGDIVYFEPLKLAHLNLLKISKRDPRWHVHPRAAEGQSPGEISINVSANSVSSSVLSMLNSHKHAAPQAIFIGKEACEVITLDSVRSIYLDGAKAVLLKIDTQGYEWQVMNGAIEKISMVRGMLIEMSLVYLYKGQRLWQDIIERLGASGFTLWALQPAFLDPKNGRTLQLDGLFFRL